MSGFNSLEKRSMLCLARASIDLYLKFQKVLKMDGGDLPSALFEERACFVSLHMDRSLRGCIGSLSAFRPLAFDIINNAIACATQDLRFSPLSVDEFPFCKIAISVLTKPLPLKVRNSEDLLAKLRSGRDGLVIKKGFNSATFLPVVWDDLSEKEEFLTHLCLKAGLRADAWRSPFGMEFFTYEAEEFSE